MNELTPADWKIVDFIAAVTKRDGKFFPWWKTVSTATYLPQGVVKQSVNHLVEVGLLVEADDHYGVTELLFTIAREGSVR